MACIIPLAALCLFAPTTETKADTTTTVVADNGTYTVTIPTDVAIDPNNKSADLTVSAELESYKKLGISITSDNNYQLKCGDKYGLRYTLTDSSEKSINQITYSTQTGTQQTFSMTLKATLGDDTAKVSGIYSDILKFTMSCQECYPEGKAGLSFDANGGTVATDKKVLDIGIEYGDLPEATRTGYTFAGWYTEKEAGQQVVKTNKLTQNTTIYAHWKANTYRVVYDNNVTEHTQASGSMEVSTMTYDSKQCLQKSTLKNNDSGAHFTGWNTKADGTGTSYTDGQEVLNLITEANASITLYAQWEYENIVKVQFEDVNGNYLDQDTQVVINQILPAGQGISWSVKDLPAYKENQQQWEKQWKTPENVGTVTYTTSNESKITAVKIERQLYYLDLNAQWYDSNGKPVSPGSGNLKWDDVVTATATVAINNGEAETQNDGTDYFKQQKYGSAFTIKVTMKPGYKLIGVYTGNEQPLCAVKFDKDTNTITGIVTGERYIENSSGAVNKYHATTVALMIQKESSDNTITISDTEEQKLDENMINLDSSVIDQNSIPSEDTKVEESETETVDESKEQDPVF